MKLVAARAALGLASIALLSLPLAAHAGDGDLQVYRLGNPNTPGSLANERFQLLMFDLGMAITPSPGHPGETLGRLGGSLEMGVRYIPIHANAAVDDGACPTLNPDCRIWVTRGSHPGTLQPTSQAGFIVAPVLHVRKGLPFSVEFEGKGQYIPATEMFMISAGVRWAAIEGLPVFLPDVSFGAVGTRFFGNQDFGLTTAAADVVASWDFGIGGMITLTPYGGYQRVLVSGASELIDFDPGNEDPSNPTGDDTLFRDVELDDPENMDSPKHRFFGGVRINSYIIQASGEVVYQPGFLGLSDTIGGMLKLGVDF